MGNKKSSIDTENSDEELKEVRSSTYRSEGGTSSISSISLGSEPLSDEAYMALLETKDEKKGRIRSHFVVYSTTMIMTIGFSIVISGTWPYLVELAGGEEYVTKTQLGWVVAANPFGQMIASPIVGYIGNRLGKIRKVCYFTVTCFVLGNVLYGLLPLCTDLWENSYYHLMILSRFIVGLSSSNITLCRSYVASSTTLKERTKGISFISASQALGFVIGPAIQMVLTLTIEDDMRKYSSAGWVTAFLGCFNFILLTPLIFKEFNIAIKEKELLRRLSPNKEEEVVLPKPDYVALVAILVSFFLVQFIYVLLETLTEPFLQDQYGLCDDIAVVLVGIIFICGGISAIFMFTVAAKMAKRFDERKLLMYCGFIPLCIGTFLFFPWGDTYLNYCGDYSTSTWETTTYTYSSKLSSLSTGLSTPVFLDRFDVVNPQLLYRGKRVDEEKVDSSQSSFEDRVDEVCGDEECLGCPAEQEWCEDYPRLGPGQLILGYAFIFFGYPFGIALSNTIFSKILGPNPQGTWMGILTATGSFSRIVGPIYVTYVYTNCGTRVTFASILVFMILGFVDIAVNYKRLVPMKTRTEEEGKF